jgi:hypothetical protein
MEALVEAVVTVAAVGEVEAIEEGHEVDLDMDVGANDLLISWNTMIFFELPTLNEPYE